MAKKALIFWGGWDGHQPREIAGLLADGLRDSGFDVRVEDNLAVLAEPGALDELDLIVPVWTMGTIEGEQERALTQAVARGVGIAGCHGGMCDAFRSATEYQFMTGGQWVSHPGNDGVDYTVKITRGDHFITEGAPAEFPVKSEQYYMHVDPAVQVLATTQFPTADGPHVKNGPVDMPVIWTKFYGEGRVAFNSLGHNADVVAQPVIFKLIMRGLLWAAHAEG